MERRAERMEETEKIFSRWLENMNKGSVKKMHGHG
jgi:hypothetical protein